MVLADGCRFLAAAEVRRGSQAHFAEVGGDRDDTLAGLESLLVAGPEPEIVGQKRQDSSEPGSVAESVASTSASRSSSKMAA